MQALPFKMLLRKKGTAQAILAVALLIALVTAVNCVVNNLNSQTTVLSKLAGSGSTFLVTSKDSTGLLDSCVDSALVHKIRNTSEIQYVNAQLVVSATLTTESGTYKVKALGIDDLDDYFRIHPTTVNGSFCKKSSEVNLGVIATNLCNATNGTNLTLSVNGKTMPVTVAGVVRGTQQSDAEVIMPISALQNLTTSERVSYVEFSVKDPANASVVVADLSETLPTNVAVTCTRQVTVFATDINTQTALFINVWSIAVYVVVAAASYVVASRAISEAEYELWLLRTLGAKKRLAFNLILTYVLVVGLVGSVVGVAVGIVGTQVASTFMRWLWGSSLLAPFLEVVQAVWVLLLGFVAVFFGGLTPAVLGSRRSTEVSL